MGCQGTMGTSVTRRIDEMVELIHRTQNRPIRDIQQLNQQTYLRGPLVKDDFSKTLENALNASVCVESNGSGSIVMLNNKPHVLAVLCQLLELVNEICDVEIRWLWHCGDRLHGRKGWRGIHGNMKRPPGVIYSMPISKATPKKTTCRTGHNPYHWYDEVVGKSWWGRRRWSISISAEVENLQMSAFWTSCACGNQWLTNIYDGSSGSPMFTVNKMGQVGGFSHSTEYNSDANEFVAQEFA